MSVFSHTQRSWSQDMFVLVHLQKYKSTYINNPLLCEWCDHLCELHIVNQFVMLSNQQSANGY